MKKAQLNPKFLIVLMLAVVVFVLAIALASPLNNVAQEARSGDLNCSSETLDSFQKGACVQIDLIPPFIIFLLLGAAGVLLGGAGR